MFPASAATRYAFPRRALSGYSGSSVDPSTFPCQPALDLAPHPGFQYQAHGQHPQTTWDDGHQGWPASQSYNFGESSALPVSQEYTGFGNFDDFTASLRNLDGFDFNSITLHDQPWIPDVQTLNPAADGLQLNFAASFEPQQAFGASPPGPIAAPPPAREERVACSHGCGKTFRRAGDCRRHMLKHGPPKFNCVVIGCEKTFHRADKLRAHVKRGHKMTL
jgi:hypothetical protein